MRFIWDNRKLIKRLIIRETEARYKSTMLGLLWLVMTPLFMLSIYAFVFSSILKAKWPNTSNSEFEFAIILYCGLIVFTLFAEFVNRAPNLILENTNYVKKVIFPVEILPIVALGSALLQAIVSYCILLIFYLLFYGSLHWTIIFSPLIIFPFLLLLSGMGLILSSLGVFI
ncbi:MAG: ABC transporter permease, partial [gamma proteobacterium symbiont of Taylorina sp.]|nr:ABC transporter permease [gamma proteobacterium symbiont of Taylorina sp.]